MDKLHWVNNQHFENIFQLIHGAFVGWITENMLGAYFRIEEISNLNLIVFFSAPPTETEKTILEQEVIFYINESSLLYEILNVRYESNILTGTFGEYREKNGGFINSFWPIFRKYELMNCDLER